jgi:hypothetical protein
MSALRRCFLVLLTILLAPPYPTASPALLMKAPKANAAKARNAAAPTPVSSKKSAAAVAASAAAEPAEEVSELEQLLRENPLNMPHDAIHKAFFSPPKEAAAIFQALLPGLAGSVCWDKLRNMRNETHNTAGGVLRADLVFSAPLLSSQGWVQFGCIFLNEAQSTQEHFQALRLLGYQCGFWTDAAKDHPGEPLPYVVPIVFYNGKHPWTTPTDFEHLFPVAADPAAAAVLAEFVPKFKFVVLDLPRLTPNELVGTALGKAVLDLMASVHRDDVKGWILRHTKLLAQLDKARGDDRRKVDLIIRYLLSTNRHLSLPDVKELFSDLPKPVKGRTMTIAEYLQDQGMRQGVRKGRLQGVRQGELIGDIGLLQYTLGLRETPRTVLRRKDVSELQAILAELKAQGSRARRTRTQPLKQTSFA